MRKGLTLDTPGKEILGARLDSLMLSVQFRLDGQIYWSKKGEGETYATCSVDTKNYGRLNTCWRIRWIRGVVGDEVHTHTHDLQLALFRYSQSEDGWIRAGSNPLVGYSEGDKEFR